MTAFPVDVADLQKHTQLKVERVMKTYQVAIVKAWKEKEVAEGQFVVLDSEKVA